MDLWVFTDFDAFADQTKWSTQKWSSCRDESRGCGTSGDAGRENRGTTGRLARTGMKWRHLFVMFYSPSTSPCQWKRVWMTLAVVLMDSVHLSRHAFFSRKQLFLAEGIRLEIFCLHLCARCSHWLSVCHESFWQPPSQTVDSMCPSKERDACDRPCFHSVFSTRVELLVYASGAPY